MKKQIIFDFYKTIYNPDSKKLYRGILPVLKTLSIEYSLILVSTTNKERISQINKLLPRGLFTKIILCQEKSFELFRKLSLESDKTIIIGDKTEEEIFFGQKLNLKTIQVNPQAENPCLTILKLIRRNNQ